MLTHHQIAPDSTDPRIRTLKKGDKQFFHQAYLGDGPRRGQLLLFLPGHGLHAANYTAFLETAAQEGYHVLGLEYINDGPSISALCGDSSECYYAAHFEAMYGLDTSPKVFVDRPNSIVNRLVMVLASLARDYPGEGWQDYMVSGKVFWNKVVAAGHSHGSAQAALIARKYELPRVVMFAGVADGHDEDVKPAEGPIEAVHWVTRTHQTPSERYYGFIHRKDIRVERALANWEALGLPGAPKPITEAPFESHRLTADDPRESPHGAVAMNADYRKVWKYLLGGLD